jgi:hypothetical protein
MVEALVLTLDIFVNGSVAIDWLTGHDKNTSLKALLSTTAKQVFSQTKCPSKLTMKLASRMGPSVVTYYGPRKSSETRSRRDTRFLQNRCIIGLIIEVQGWGMTLDGIILLWLIYNYYK